MTSLRDQGKMSITSQILTLLIMRALKVFQLRKAPRNSDAEVHQPVHVLFL